MTRSMLDERPSRHLRHSTMFARRSRMARSFPPMIRSGATWQWQSPLVFCGERCSVRWKAADRWGSRKSRSADGGKTSSSGKRLSPRCHAKARRPHQ
jgi:hypothetical protein